MAQRSLSLNAPTLRQLRQMEERNGCSRRLPRLRRPMEAEIRNGITGIDCDSTVRGNEPFVPTTSRLH